MSSVKEKVSFTINAKLLKWLAEAAETQKTSKSALMERALLDWIEMRFEADAKATAQIKIKDLPTGDEWLKIDPKW